MFVTPNDFNLIPYNIPNLKLVENTFPDYIARKEEEILVQLLGYKMYVDFITSLMALPAAWDAATAYVIGDEVTFGVSIWQALTDSTGQIPHEGTDWTKVEDNKWLKLKNGSTYTDYGEDEYWLGMTNMLVPFIYSEWLADTFDNYSGIGVVESKAENSNVIEPKLRVVRAYNDFVELAGTGSDDGCGCGCKGGGIYSVNSLAGFLSASNATDPEPYPDWTPRLPHFKNTFGI